MYLLFRLQSSMESKVLSTLKDAGFSKMHIRVLNSLMAGGANWEKYTAGGDSCLDTCPFYTRCKGSGPHGVCSTRWSNAEATPDVLDVVFHVSNNFSYYNCGDISVPGADRVLSEIRSLVHELRSRLAEDDIEEGSQVLRLHRYRERNSAVARQKKDEALAEGRLECEACGVDYLALYGGRGVRLIECHHAIPLSSEAHNGRTNKSDLLLLCANCHRLAHSEKEPLPLPALQSLVQSRKK